MTGIKGLLVMDVDSTLIQEEVIELLGQEAGFGQEISAITERAMNGELDFEVALTERVALLKGLPVSVFDQVIDKIRFQVGAKELIRELRERGYKVGVVSGGFHEVVDSLATQLDLDYVKANRLEVAGGVLTGRTIGDIVTKDTKVAKLKEWATENGLDLSQTIAIGDGVNDLPMIKMAGLGVAFCAKPVVRAQSPYQINEPNLYQLIDLLDRLW